MEGNLFLVLGSAIRQREEIICIMSDITAIMRPYVLYEIRDGSFWVGGMHLPQKIPLHIPIKQILDIKLSGEPFEAERFFNLDDPRYDHAIAMIESAFHRRG